MLGGHGVLASVGAVVRGGGLGAVSGELGLEGADLGTEVGRLGRGGHHLLAGLVHARVRLLLVVQRRHAFGQPLGLLESFVGLLLGFLEVRAELVQVLVPRIGVALRLGDLPAGVTDLLAKRFLVVAQIAHFFHELGALTAHDHQ